MNGNFCCARQQEIKQAVQLHQKFFISLKTLCLKTCAKCMDYAETKSGHHIYTIQMQCGFILPCLLLSAKTPI
jgi:hypothetical protein